MVGGRRAVGVPGACGLSGSRQQAATAGHVREPHAVSLGAACKQPEAAARAATVRAHARCRGLCAQCAHCCRGGWVGRACGWPSSPRHPCPSGGACGSPTHQHNLWRQCRTCRWGGQLAQQLPMGPLPRCCMARVERESAMRANAARPVKSRPTAYPVPLHSTITGSPSCLACTQPGPAVHGEPSPSELSAAHLLTSATLG